MYLFLVLVNLQKSRRHQLFRVKDATKKKKKKLHLDNVFLFQFF